MFLVLPSSESSLDLLDECSTAPGGLQPLMDSCRTFIGVSWDENELIMYWGQQVKGQGHYHG